MAMDNIDKTITTTNTGNSISISTRSHSGYVSPNYTTVVGPDLLTQINMLKAENAILAAKIANLETQQLLEKIDQGKVVKAVEELSEQLSDAVYAVNDRIKSLEADAAVTTRQRDEAIQKNKSLSQQIRDRDEEIYELNDKLIAEKKKNKPARLATGGAGVLAAHSGSSLHGSWSYTNTRRVDEYIKNAMNYGKDK